MIFGGYPYFPGKSVFQPAGKRVLAGLYNDVPIFEGKMRKKREGRKGSHKSMYISLGGLGELLSLFLGDWSTKQTDSTMFLYDLFFLAILID